MEYQTGSPAANPGYGNVLGQDARAMKLGPPTLVRGPSIEDRLAHLQRGVERVCKLRAALDSIADRISLTPETSGGSVPCAPTPSDLTGRFGDAISDLHNQLDALERLSERIYCGLFTTNTQAQAGRG